MRAVAIRDYQQRRARLYYADAQERRGLRLNRGKRRWMRHIKRASHRIERRNALRSA